SGPDANALDLGQADDDFLVGQAGQVLEDDRARPGVPGQVADVGSFLSGESQGAHARRAKFEDGLGSDYALDGGGETAENHAGDAATELLEYDGLNEGLEIRLAKLDTIIANPFDNGGEHRVVVAEVVYGLLHLETLARRSASPLLYRHANTHFPYTWQRDAGAGPTALHQSGCGSGEHSYQRP